MKLSDDDLRALGALAIETAQRAARFVQSQAGRPLEVAEKVGGDSEASRVVTEVDLESQRLILESLAESRMSFDLGLLTEECPDDSSRHAKDYFWCVDPLDGTLPFIENVAGYSVSIALVSKDGVPMLGAIVDPVEGTTYHAVIGHGALKNGQSMDPLSAGAVDRTELTLVTDRSFAKQEHSQELMLRIEQFATGQGLSGVNTINQGGAAMNACWVADKAPALYFKFPKREAGGGALWDFAASACLFTELAAVVSDIRGVPLRLNREGSIFMNEDGVVFASSSILAEQVYALFAEFCSSQQP